MLNISISIWKPFTRGIFRVSPGVDINTLIDKLNDMVDCAFSRFIDDTDLGEVVDMLESRAAIQIKLNETEEQAYQYSWNSEKTNLKSCLCNKITSCKNTG